MIETEIDVRMSEHGLASILAAPGWEQLRQRVLSLLMGTGITDFLVRIEVDVGDGTPRMHCFGSLPTELLLSFSAELMGSGDMVNRHFARSGLPLQWCTERLYGISGGKSYAELRGRGICEGISVTARDALAQSRVDYYCQTATGHGLSKALMADLMLLGSYLHEAVRDLWSEQNSQQPPILTQREQACLYWSAVGKTGKETATILSISHHTVYFHLKNAARKFNVYSTRHAINRATQLGMIKHLMQTHA